VLGEASVASPSIRTAKARLLEGKLEFVGSASGKSVWLSSRPARAWAAGLARRPSSCPPAYGRHDLLTFGLIWRPHGPGEKLEGAGMGVRDPRRALPP
jgi:hypothetical protein